MFLVEINVFWNIRSDLVTSYAAGSGQLPRRVIANMASERAPTKSTPAPRKLPNDLVCRNTISIPVPSEIVPRHIISALQFICRDVALGWAEPISLWNGENVGFVPGGVLHHSADQLFHVDVVGACDCEYRWARPRVFILVGPADSTLWFTILHWNPPLSNVDGLSGDSVRSLPVKKQNR